MNTTRGDLEMGAADGPAAVHTSHRTRPLYWSVRRELWENRSLFIVPVIAAGVGVFGFLLHGLHGILAPHPMPAHLELVPGQPTTAAPFNATSGLLLATWFILGVFYCLDALQGERRDRSILFWKSMPVSDTTTVLAKASVPIVALPLIVIVISMATQVLMLLLSTIWVLNDTDRVIQLWTHFSPIGKPLKLMYGVTAAALWHAPIYAWALLVSGWARRAAFVWAVLPIIAGIFIETLSFQSQHIVQGLRYRVFGWASLAFEAVEKGAPPTALTPGRFLGSPDLWLGLVLAAVFLAIAVRMRRYRDPI